jgi:3',5'-cyclic-AMP phosphodiesterase
MKKYIKPFLLFRTFVLTCLLGFVAACDYELSPWTTDAYCPGMDIKSNIARLKRIEQLRGESPQFKFAVIGDPQQYPKDLSDTITHINRKNNIDFIVLLGDIAETGIAQEFEWACKALSRSEQPVLAVIGNHDALSFGQQIWHNNFGPEDYSFSFMGTKFVAFNNNKYEYPDSPSLSFLENEAAQDENVPRNLTIGFSHIQPWPDQPNLSGQLKSFGYDHMFHAHEHKFKYWQYQDVQLPHYIVAHTRFVNYAIVEVNQGSLSVTQCEPECFPAELKSR